MIELGFLGLAAGLFAGYMIGSRKEKCKNECNQSLLCFNMNESLREENKRLKLEKEYYKNKVKNVEKYIEGERKNNGMLVR